MNSKSKTGRPSFYEVLTKAINDFSSNGYDSEQRLEIWLAEIRSAAERDMLPQVEVERATNEMFTEIYKKLVDRGGLLKLIPELGRYELERAKPKLRAELDKRLLANSKLIKLNRQEAIAQTLRRFTAWAVSIPPVGTTAFSRVQTKRSIRRTLADHDYAARRRNSDQGRKFTSALSDILARDGEAIACRWTRHWSRYPRKEHIEREGKVYLLRDSWAYNAGLTKPNKDGFYDDIEKVNEFMGCLCSAQWIFGLSQLPRDMLTQKGKAELDRVRREIAA